MSCSFLRCGQVCDRIWLVYHQLCWQYHHSRQKCNSCWLLLNLKRYVLPLCVWWWNKYFQGHSCWPCHIPCPRLRLKTSQTEKSIHKKICRFIKHKRPWILWHQYVYLASVGYAIARQHHTSTSRLFKPDLSCFFLLCIIWCFESLMYMNLGLSAQGDNGNSSPPTICELSICNLPVNSPDL